MSAVLQGTALGLIGGLGFWLIAWTWARRRFTLMDRLAPYLREQSATSRLLEQKTRSPLPVVGRIAAPLLRDAGRFLEKLGSSTISVQRRISQAGRDTTVEQFRLEQVLWASVGLVGGLVVTLAAAGQGPGLVPSLVLTLVAAVTLALLRDNALTRVARAHQEALVAELPDVAEMIALAVAAGVSPLGAIERVAAIGNGALALELRGVVARTRTGMGLSAALSHLGSASASTELARFADTIRVATDRGTPLAEVLRSQARDIREHSRQRLLELGGAKEIGMVVPVVFLVLPTTVLFALYPGLAVLRVGL